MSLLFLTSIFKFTFLLSYYCGVDSYLMGFRWIEALGLGVSAGGKLRLGLLTDDLYLKNCRRFT